MFTRFPLYLDKYIYLNILTTDDKHIISMAMEGFKSYLNSVKDKTNTFFFPFFFFLPSVTWYEYFLFVGVVVQLLSSVWFFVTAWTAGHQAYLSFNISWDLLRFMSIRSVMLSNHLILYHPLLLSAWFFSSIRYFSKVISLHQAKVLELWIQSFHWIFRDD